MKIEPRPLVWEQADWKLTDIAWALGPVIVLQVGSELLSGLAPSTWLRLFQILLFGVGFAWMFFYPIHMLRRRTGRNVGLGVRCGFVRELFIAVPVFFMFLLLIVGVAIGIEAITGSPIKPAAEGRRVVDAIRVSRVWMWVQGATVCVLAPWVEEIFFRGFLYSALRKRWGWFLAAVLQALVFAGAHYHYTLGMLVVVFVCGLVLLAIYRWRRTLLGPIIIHTAFNGLIFAGAVHESRQPQPFFGVTGAPEANDCRIVEVAVGSAAAKAGLIAGDVVVSFNGEAVDSFAALQDAIAKCAVGDEVAIEWRRGDRTHTGRTTLGERRLE